MKTPKYLIYLVFWLALLVPNLLEAQLRAKDIQLAGDSIVHRYLNRDDFLTGGVVTIVQADAIIFQKASSKIIDEAFKTHFRHH